VYEIKVLCVENHPESMTLLRAILSNHGFDVLPATTGGQALTLLQLHPIDGVLLENDLPDASGAAVRADMKRIKPDVPVLLFDGITSQTPFLVRFFDSYLRHPMRPDSAYDDLYT